MLAGSALLAAVAWRLWPSFGRLPTGMRQARIQASPNFVDGEFHNQVPTSLFTGSRGRLGSLWDFFLGSKAQRRPPHALPMVATNLRTLDPSQDVAVWLGHSSYFLQLSGRRILIDPVFSDSAAPVAIFNRAFPGTYPFSAASMPEIDCLILSHDHWDHLDYPTLIALRPKVKAVVTPLGVGAHLEAWGYAPDRLHEADWFEAVRLDATLTVHVLPARHFSGRGLRGNRTLWAGFLIETPHRRVFDSGDSGYGPHFAEIGRRFGPVDLAIMENGQYDPDWAQIHMMPEEAAQAAVDVQARTVLPSHAGRFSISKHAWDDPYQRLAEASRGREFRLLTPKLGEVVALDRPNQTFTRWWVNPAPVNDQ